MDWPVRRRAFWSQLLFEDGLGWLRWRTSTREWKSYDPPDYEEWTVAPPIRRLIWSIRGYLWSIRMARAGEIEWNEVGWEWSSYQTDPDRHYSLWRHRTRRQSRRLA